MASPAQEAGKRKKEGKSRRPREDSPEILADETQNVTPMKAFLLKKIKELESEKRARAEAEKTAALLRGAANVSLSLPPSLCFSLSARR